MRVFTLSIRMDNAAFADEPEEELSRILRALCKSGKLSETEGVLHDVNGNKVGSWTRL